MYEVRLITFMAIIRGAKMLSFLSVDLFITFNGGTAVSEQ